VDYHASGDNPFLHTWSLAVEEQMYLVWPLLFLLVARLYRGKIDETDDAASLARRRLLIWVGVAGVVSFLLSLWLTRVSQPWAFFGMPTRIWEFAAGGMLALSMGTPDPERARRGVVLQILGIAAIVVSVAAYSRVTPYPGFAALLPAAGGVGLLVGGHHAPDGWVSRILSVGWLRSLGRLSYAWYLWHWPLVGIGSVLDLRIGVAGKLAWSAGALGLAWLTHRFLEAPARDPRFFRIPPHRVTMAALGASVAAAIVAHGAMFVGRRQAAAPDQQRFAAAREDRMRHGCWSTTIEEWKGPCEFGDLRSATTLVLLGDSHAEHWLGALDRAGRENGWKVVALVKGGCPVAEMPQFMNARLKRYYHECTRFREAMVRRIIAMRPAAVILSSWDHYMPTDGNGSDWQVTPTVWRDGLRRTYSRLAGAGVPIVAVRGTPRTWFDVPACLSRRAAGLPGSAPCVYDRAAALSPVAIRAQNEAARGLPIRFVDMNDQICSTAACPVVRGGTVVFTDDNHLTASFSRSLAPVFARRLASATGLDNTRRR
jgi:hypothetical protein